MAQFSPSNNVRGQKRGHCFAASRSLVLGNLRSVLGLQHRAKKMEHERFVNRIVMEKMSTLMQS
jgi:hypothetical protein